MIEFGVLLLLGVAVIAACALAVLIKAVCWIVLLPFRILFWTVAGLVSLPLILLSAVFGGALLFLALPLLLVSLFGALAVALLLPLLPLLLVALLVWLLVVAPSRAVVT